VPEITINLSDNQLRWARQKGEKTRLEIDGFIRYLIERDIEASRVFLASGETISPYPVRASYTFERRGER
jgi:hypothetical protein